MSCVFVLVLVLVLVLVRVRVRARVDRRCLIRWHGYKHKGKAIEKQHCEITAALLTDIG